LADGDASTAALRAPQGLALDGDRLFVADAGNHAIRSIDLSTGRVVTVAGTGALGRGPPETADPLSVALRSPWDLDCADGVLFIAMAGSHQLWVLQLDERLLVPFGGSGAEGHVDGPIHEGALAQPSAVRVWGDRVYFVDAETSSVRALDLRTATLGTLIGHGLFDFGDVDGGPDDARLQHPLGLCVDAEGLLVADTYNHKIKRLDPSTLQIRTVAGGPGALTEPSGIERLGGFALIADAHADRIAAIDLATGEIRGVPIVEAAP
jgi:DNA-binding beta-propeller fold protein YncE